MFYIVRKTFIKAPAPLCFKTQIPQILWEILYYYRTKKVPIIFNFKNSGEIHLLLIRPEMHHADANVWYTVYNHA
jgi:hypothetical protein